MQARRPAEGGHQPQPPHPENLPKSAGLELNETVYRWLATSVFCSRVRRGCPCVSVAIFRTPPRAPHHHLCANLNPYAEGFASQEIKKNTIGKKNFKTLLYSDLTASSLPPPAPIALKYINKTPGLEPAGRPGLLPPGQPRGVLRVPQGPLRRRAPRRRKGKPARPPREVQGPAVDAEGGDRLGRPRAGGAPGALPALPSGGVRDLPVEGGPGDLRRVRTDAQRERGVTREIGLGMRSISCMVGSGMCCGCVLGVGREKRGEAATRGLPTASPELEVEALDRLFRRAFRGFLKRRGLSRPSLSPLLCRSVTRLVTRPRCPHATAKLLIVLRFSFCTARPRHQLPGAIG